MVYNVIIKEFIHEIDTFLIRLTILKDSSHDNRIQHLA
jgi:hypothetical protein